MAGRCWGLSPRELGQTFVKALKESDRDHLLAFAAGLSYYFMLSLFPLLIFVSAFLAYLPIPDPFNQILYFMGRIVPPDAFGVVQRIVAEVLTPQAGSFLTIGFIAAVWTSSSGFTAMIEALNVAYEVPESRSLIKTRLLAIGLTFVIGGLMIVALAVLVVGPQFGGWLAGKVGLSPQFAVTWYYLRWVVAVAFTVLAIEILYFIAPNVKQRFWFTLPGAIVAVVIWITASQLLGLYLQNFGDYNKVYGALGAVVILMLWFYITGAAILFGGEFNCEILKACGQGALPVKELPAEAPPPMKAA